jgi:hypothetical protein
MDTPSPDSDSPAGMTPAPRTIDADRGVGWWSEAWAMFVRSALMWVALAVIFFVGLAVVGMVPVLGSVAGALLLPVFIGGWMLAARKVQDGGALEVGDLFAGFQGERMSALLVLGVLLLAAMIVIGLVAGMLGLGAVFGMFAGGMHRSTGGMMAAMGAAMGALVVALVLGTLVTMALWFAPALVVFRKMPPIEAVKLSTVAVLKNALPFLVYGLIYIVASIVASIPLGLGWFVLLPLSLLTVYVSYRDVFEPA